MAYPQKGASYRHEPAFMKRMLEAEKHEPQAFRQSRAEGGDVSDQTNPPIVPVSGLDGEERQPKEPRGSKED